MSEASSPIVELELLSPSVVVLVLEDVVEDVELVEVVVFDTLIVVTCTGSRRHGALCAMISSPTDKPIPSIPRSSQGRPPLHVRVCSV
jgi:hypothetical protein